MGAVDGVDGVAVPGYVVAGAHGGDVDHGGGEVQVRVEGGV